MPPRARVCPVCKNTYQPKGGKPQVTCSFACRRARGEQPFERPCADCDVPVLTHSKALVLCSAHKAERRRAHYRRKNVVRRGAAVAGPAMSIEQLGKRDGWRCHLCPRRVNPALRSPHPLSATFDHLIPVADGGTDAPENLRLAHRTCNTRRGTRGNVQLLLVG